MARIKVAAKQIILLLGGPRRDAPAAQRGVAPSISAFVTCWAQIWQHRSVPKDRPSKRRRLGDTEHFATA
jgi:hypothetical protein